MKQTQLLVTAAIIEDNGKYLITKRPNTKYNGNRWEFPGGKVEFGEDLRSSIEREIKEELSITIKAQNLFGYSSFVYQNNKHIILLGFHCKYVSGTIQHIDVADHKFVTTEELKQFDITEADLPFVKKLQRLK